MISLDPEWAEVPDPAQVAEIRRGVMHLSRRLRTARGPDAMSPGKLSLLSHLTRRGPMTPGHLAVVEFLRPQSLTRLLAELEHDGLVVREPHPDDGRQYLVTISDTGRAALERDVSSRDAWLAQAMLSLSPIEREVLSLAGRLMESLADDAGVLQEEAAPGKPGPRLPEGGRVGAR